MNWTEIAANWKTTVSSILTVTLVTTAGLLTYPPIMAHPKVISILGGVQIVAKIWIGLISHDAKPSVTSSVTIESTAPVNVPPVVVTANPPQETK